MYIHKSKITCIPDLESFLSLIQIHAVSEAHFQERFHLYAIEIRRKQSFLFTTNQD